MRMVHDTAHIWRWKKWFFRETNAGNTVLFLWQRRNVALQQRLETCAMRTFFFCAAEAANMTLSAKLKCAKNTENVFFRLIFWNGFNLDGGADLGFRLLFMVFRSF